MTKRIAILLLVLVFLVVVPFLLWEDSFVELSNRLLSMNGSRWIIAAVVIVMLGLDIMLPIPSSLLSVAGGAYLGFTLGTITCLIGMTLGCALGHFLGYWLHEDRIRPVVSPGDKETMNRFFARQGPVALTLARPVPVMAEVSVIMAGVSGMSLSKLFLYTVPANLGISLVYAAVGHYSMQVESFLWAFAGAVVIPVVFYCMLRFLRILWPGRGNSIRRLFRKPFQGL